MADYVDLERQGFLVDDGNESKVIINHLADIPGGRALNVEAWNEDVILAGHIIKHDKQTGSYAPLGVSGSAYVALGANEEYAGVLMRSVPKSKPSASILTVGQVNAAASPYPVTDTIKAGLQQIKFLY